jgi:hypothetical protein
MPDWVDLVSVEWVGFLTSRRSYVVGTGEVYTCDCFIVQSG